MTAHDGFTLCDLVSYNQKHNEANGEGNRDGTDENLSWNHGVEGETSDPQIQELRARQMRNFLTTLFVSQGVPMLLHGDEVARTQRGNNNAYCQDSELTWQPWDLTREQREMLEWTRRLVRLRKTHSVLRRRNYFRGRPIRGEGTTDILWLSPSGQEMTEAQWLDPSVRTIAVFLAGDAADITDEEGRPLVGDSLLILLNSSDQVVDFTLLADARGRPWRLVLDTARPRRSDITRRFLENGAYRTEPRSAAILQLRYRGSRQGAQR